MPLAEPGNERLPSIPAQQTLPFGRRLLFGCGAGVLLALCFPPVGLYALLPLCLGALLGLLRGVTLRQAFYIGIGFGTAWFCGDLFWIARLFGPAALSLCVILALFPALYAVLYVWLRTRLPRVPVWLLAPLLWTGIEYYRSELFVLKFGWLGLGYGVVNAPLLAYFASWFGCYGLSFVIVLLGAVLLAMFTSETGVPQRRKALWRVAPVLAVWLAVCLIPLPAPSPSHPLHVRLVQANSEDEDSFYRLSRPPVGLSANLSANGSANVPADTSTGALADVPADIIVWPEYSFYSDPNRTLKLWPKIKRIAQENHAYLLFGAKDQFDPKDEAGFRNTAFLLAPNGDVIGRHVKNHPVHFIRDGVAGTQARAIPTALGRLGVAICFDMDYPDVARRLAQDGAVVFLVPNDDPPEWGPVQRVQHRLLFQMRAVECGRWLGRADVAGGTSVAAPTGQEIARIGTTQPAALDALLGRETGRTLFVRGGWRFGQICLLVAVLLCGAALTRRFFAASGNYGTV